MSVLGFYGAFRQSQMPHIQYQMPHIGAPCPVCGTPRAVVARDHLLDKFACEMVTYSGLHKIILWHDVGGPIEAPTADPRYPHKCPKCSGPAYVGLLQIEHPAGVTCG
jgi:hypothetical protein